MKGQENIGEQELVGHTAEKKNWKGIFIALLVILVVISLVVIAIVLLSPGPKNSNKKEKFTFDDFFDPSFQPKSFHATWVQNKDEELFMYRDDDGALYMFNCSTNETSPNRKIMMMDNRTFRELNSAVYFVSPDRKFVLLAHDQQQVYRYSSLSQYSTYSVDHGVYSPFNPPGATSSRFQYVGWSSFGHSLVYVQENNIYYLRDPNHESGELPTQITSDGEPGRIFNGIPDWAYEEDILYSDHALWWSPDGKHIAYAVINDTDVRNFYYPFYGDMENPYGEERYIAYPKPGAKIPTFRIKVYDIERRINVEINPPEQFKDREYYFTSVAWRDNDFFLVAYLNRPQNLSLVQACNAATGKCTLNQKINGGGAWVDLHRPPLFSKDGKRYFWIVPSREGSTGYFKHVAMIEFPVSDTQKLTKVEGIRSYITGGTMDATEIVGFDQSRETLYFIGAPDPRKRHLYSVSSNSSHTNFRATKCLTCNYDKTCQYVTASFSPSGRYYVLGCLGPGVPYYVLKSTYSNDELILESNDLLKKKLSRKALPRPHYFRIPVSENEYLHGKLLWPPELKEEEILTYPLLLSVYGSPDTQKVTEEFRIEWETYLCSSNKIIIGYVDARGTSARGLGFLHSIYRRLGTLDVMDTIEAGNLYDKLPYVESSKKAIWGLSYGGFLTASVLGSRDPPNPFDCGIAVAPVTDWNYYGAVYTERYMGTPYENPHGYRLSNVSRHAENFRNSRFMLIHGTGDDNVHFQNSAQLMKALVEANVYFRSQIYTDENHYLNGINTRRHLYETMEDFLNECFHGKSKKFELKTKLLQQTKQEPIEE